VYSSVPCVNRSDTPEIGWIHLKVGTQCVLFLVGRLAINIGWIDKKWFPKSWSISSCLISFPRLPCLKTGFFESIKLSSKSIYKKCFCCYARFKNFYHKNPTKKWAIYLFKNLIVDLLDNLAQMAENRLTIVKFWWNLNHLTIKTFDKCHIFRRKDNCLIFGKMVGHFFW